MTRVLGSAKSVLWTLSLCILSGCNTGAVAVEQCREIEHARCEASVSCGTISEGDVAECKRIYNDQCLHGIAGPEAPTANQQDACLDLINEAGQDAADRDEESDEYEAACDIVGEPWDSQECAFLLPSMGGSSGDDDDEDDDG